MNTYTQPIDNKCSCNL